MISITRAVLVDLEPGTMDSVRSGPYGQVTLITIDHNDNNQNYYGNDYIGNMICERSMMILTTMMISVVHFGLVVDLRAGKKKVCRLEELAKPPTIAKQTALHTTLNS